MDITGSFDIPASAARVWQALNDPEVLKQCIPGCESLARTGENTLEATVVAKIGPVSAKFGGAVTLENLDPPHGYTLRGEGKGGAAGFAKGEAKVTLTPIEGGTRLDYVATAQVGGKLAQIGSRLVQGSATKIAGDFFARFSEAVAETPDTAPEMTVPEEVVAEEAVMETAGMTSGGTAAAGMASIGGDSADAAAQKPLSGKIGWIVAAVVAVIAVALIVRH